MFLQKKLPQVKESSLSNINREILEKETLTLFISDLDFLKSVTQATNNSLNIHKRITSIYNMLKGLI